MTLHQVLLILRARYKVALYLLLFTVVATLLVSLLLPKQYTATTAVVVDVKSPDPIAGMVLPGLASPAYMATQVDIINSDRVAHHVVKMLRLDESPGIREQWMDAMDGEGELIVWLTELLKKNLNVKPSRESNVINIEFSGVDPEFAATVANAFAKAYIDINLQLKVEPARQYATWFEDQARALREDLERAQQALSVYQQKVGIVATEDRLDHEIAKLNEISTQLTVIQAQTSESASKRKTMQSAETLSEVMQSPLINSLKADIARLEGKFQEGSVNLGVNHPQTKRVQSELTTLKTKLDEEIRRIRNSIDTTYQVSKQRERELLDALESQKKKVLELSSERDQVSVLQRDVEVAQRNFEGVNLRAAQTKLESNSIQTNVVILNPALAPTKHSHPKILLNTIIATFLGTLIGIGAALVLELGDRRIRSVEDLAQIVEFPVFVAISPRDLSSVSSGFVRKFFYRKPFSAVS